MQYHEILCNSMQYHAIQCETMQDHSRPCNTMQNHVVLCNTMQHHATLFNTMQYNAIPCNAMQYHAILITADGAYHCLVGSIRPFLTSSLWGSMHYGLKKTTGLGIIPKKTIFFLLREWQGWNFFWNIWIWMKCEVKVQYSYFPPSTGLNQ